ncbi:hypothetical protein RB600_002078 [Gaeumannomyces tritici]
MFSEYASRFLAQSQSRISNLGAPHDDNGEQQPAIRGGGPEWPARGSRHGRTFMSSGRGLAAGNPYQQTGTGSRFGGLNFASRYSAAPAPEAPLFLSTRGGDDDDDDERDREHADFSALQRSRRVIAAGRLEESSEVEGDASRGSLERSGEADQDSRTLYGPRGRGIRSSWNGTRSFYRRTKNQDLVEEEDEDEGTPLGKRPSPPPSDNDSGKGKLVDVGLESTVLRQDDDDYDDNEPPHDLTVEAPATSSPPAFQKFKSPASPTRFSSPRRSSRRDSAAAESEVGLLRQSTASTNILEHVAAPPDGEIFKHDPFFAWLYLIALASLFATFVLVYLHTSTPSRKKPLGDTVYTTLVSSFHLLAVDTLVAIIVSFVWLAALRSFVKPLVWLIIIAVPIIMFSFTLYPMISSFQGRDHGSGLQDIVMRWASFVPGIGALVWLYLVWKGRGALRSAMEILEFSSRILAANHGLVLVGAACLGLIVLWTWVWLGMFTRVFLGGYFTGTSYVLQASTWWLAVYFVLMYLWTLSIISGVQRGTTAATVSQWYFHRNAVPAPSSTEVVSAALGHSTTTIFGSISLSTLLALVIRLPLLLLPRRLAGLVTLFFHAFIPTSIAALTNPLTLTYAAIHSQGLAASARGLSQLNFLSPEAPTATLTPKAFRHGRRGGPAPLLPYRLAKLLLHATRFIMATTLGFAGWIMTARQLSIESGKTGGGPGLRGSAYAYVVGIVASFIGWGVLGAMEGILSGIVDGVIICYGSETRMAAGGGRYCMEAAYLFGDQRRAADRAARDGGDVY